MPYPAVLTEDQTLRLALQGRSISRFGDGELRLAIGGQSISQKPDEKLALELQKILMRSSSICCIPNPATPNRDVWDTYATGRYASLYRPDRTYGSSFITRPDNAPWIDTTDYWERVRKLWVNRDVVLVAGSDRSLTKESIASARNLRTVQTPRRDAFSEIDRIEEEIGTSAWTVLLCAGATATVLAERLERKGIHAVDLGHIGMFMRHAGAYRCQSEELASAAYIETLKAMHASQKWGGDGAKHASAVTALANNMKAHSVLDYGCGRGKLKEALANIKVNEFDPGVPAKSKLPKPADLVVCTDVMEHVEQSKIPAVLRHIFQLAGNGAYFVISLRPANAILPDGRNAHLSLMSPMAWQLELGKAGWDMRKARISIDEGKELRIWLTK